jgi:CDP-glycerol glycerophosphotransferase (TagB/SpsB family)
MSAARSIGGPARLLFTLLASALGWALVVPVAWLVPKRRNWIAVIGRQDGQFLDNAKYFFLQAHALAPGARLVFVSERAGVVELITGAGREALCFPGVRSAWFLMRCGTVVVDEASWYRRMRYFLLIRARVVQLWHGVGCKWIEIQQWRREAGAFGWASHPVVLAARLLFYRLIGRRARYAMVATTSAFYRDEVFEPAFLASHYPVTGYPRNDFALSLEGPDRELAWRNVDRSISSKLAGWALEGKKLVLVAPTFRDSGTLPMHLDALALESIDAFGETHGVEFLFKFHPSERNADQIRGRHFHVCSRDSDVYPLLPHASALVTDYSSISMDFLWVDKPLLFLVPENDDYASSDRGLQFEPRTMMPGPIVSSWPLLLPALLDAWSNDGHVAERAALRRQAFDDLPQSQATSRIIAFARAKRWFCPRSQ